MPLLGGAQAIKPIVPTGPKAMGVQRPSSRVIDKSAMLKLGLNDLRDRDKKNESPLLESVQEAGVSGRHKTTDSLIRKELKE